MKNLTNDKWFIQDIELLQTHLDEKSVHTPDQFIAHRLKIRKKTRFTLPSICILGFFPKLYHYIQNRYNPEIIDWFNSRYPYYIFKKNKRELAYIFAGIGAPISGMILEESISLGAEVFIFLGTAGSLKPSIPTNELLIPTKAVRDEGTSFHYQKAERYAWPEPELIRALEENLDHQGIGYHKGIVWSTDGVYREVPSKIKRLRNEGCICVDMEASALFSIARYYNKKIAGIFSIRDILKEDHWEMALHHDSKPFFNPATLFEISTKVFEFYQSP